MVRFASVFVVALLPTAASAEECPRFGLSSDYLATLFCQQLEDIVPETTRSSRPEDQADTLEITPPDPRWLALEPVAEAWRSDPAKTLSLIERIRDAGGRPEN